MKVRIPDFSFKCSIGLFSIYKNEAIRRFQLEFNNREVGQFRDAHEAAAAVREKKTGVPEWDNQTDFDGPETIEQWSH